LETPDHGRAARQVFVAKAIVTEVETEKQIQGVISNLSLFGCYVETPTPFSRGINVELTITHSGQKFMVLGKIAHARSQGHGYRVYVNAAPRSSDPGKVDGTT
jgi:hypothetical protein